MCLLIAVWVRGVCRGINAGRWTGALAVDRMLRYTLLSGQVVALFLFLLACKMLIGWCTQNLAVRYMNRHRANYPGASAAPLASQSTAG